QPASRSVRGSNYGPTGEGRHTRSGRPDRVGPGHARPRPGRSARDRALLRWLLRATKVTRPAALGAANLRARAPEERPQRGPIGRLDGQGPAIPQPREREVRPRRAEGPQQGAAVIGP